MNKPTVAHVVESFGGGVIQSIREICEPLQNDFNFIIVHDMRAETPQNYAELFPKSVRFIRLDMGREVSPKQDIKRALKLRKIIKREGADVVHAHSSKAGALARVGLIGCGAKVLYSPRGYSFLMTDSKPLKRAFYVAIEFLLGLMPATTVACGHDEHKIAKRVSLSSCCVPNSFTVKKDCVRPPVKNKLKVISCGRISPQKNFGMFCEIAELLKGEKIEFLWIGGGDEKAYKIPKNVKVTGWLNHDEVMSKMAEGHVYVHLSKWEGLSRVVLEAMAFGYPLILSDISGNRELISDGNGVLCKTSCVAANNLKRFANNHEEIIVSGDKSTNHLKHNYNPKNSVKMWRELYKK